MKDGVFGTALIVAALLFTIPLLAQKNAKPQMVHLSSDKVGLQIRDTQITLMQTAQAYTECSNQMKQLPQAFQEQTKQLGSEIDEAYKSQGLSKTDYSFDPKTLDFTLIPKTPVLPAKAPAKKP